MERARPHPANCAVLWYSRNRPGKEAYFAIYSSFIGDIVGVTEDREGYSLNYAHEQPKFISITKAEFDLEYWTLEQREAILKRPRI